MAEGVVTHRFGKRRGNSANLEDLIARLRKQFAQRVESEEAGMRAVENPFAAIVEFAEQQQPARYREGDIRSGQNDFRTLARGGGAQSFHENLRILEVLDDI